MTVECLIFAVDFYENLNYYLWLKDNSKRDIILVVEILILDKDVYVLSLRVPYLRGIAIIRKNNILFVKVALRAN